MIQRGRPGAMDPPFLFAHVDDPLSRPKRRGEMNMAHLCEGISNGVIDRAFTDFPTLNVSDRNSQRQRNGCGREHFVSVGDEKKYIRPHLTEKVRETQCGIANRLGHSYVAIRTEETFDSSVNSETIVFDFLHCVAELRREVRS